MASSLSEHRQHRHAHIVSVQPCPMAGHKFVTVVGMKGSRHTHRGIVKADARAHIETGNDGDGAADTNGIFRHLCVQCSGSDASRRSIRSHFGPARACDNVVTVTTVSCPSRPRPGQDDTHSRATVQPSHGPNHLQEQRPAWATPPRARFLFQHSDSRHAPYF